VSAAKLNRLAAQIAKSRFVADKGKPVPARHAAAVGNLLIQAQRLCEAGAWKAWLARSFDGSERTAQVYMRVAARWSEVEAKVPNTAALSLNEACKLLVSKAVQRQIKNRRAARKKARKVHQQLVAQKPPADVLKTIKYACILIDASWYRANKYELLEEIQDLPIANYAADDAIIFIRTGGSSNAAMWAEIFLNRWDFKTIDDPLLLKGAIKKSGRWFNTTVEEIVVGYCGQPDWPKQKPDGLIECGPDDVHKVIERLTPFAKNLRLELFSRNPRKGWVCWADGKEPVAV
jgi:N6-adenosine-specific RNA methylase IME4